MKSMLRRVSFSSLIVFVAFSSSNIVYAAAGIQGKLTQAMTVLQTILMSLVVVVGICVALFVIIKRMPSADDPHEKNEVFKSVARICIMVALAAAMVWVVPWVYGLFT
ncbi:MAG: CagC family type IV secretion system protein [Caryophanon sp.]|nr:CagC family type IV secretion system protein [Caryophanon sp.]